MGLSWLKPPASGKFRNGENFSTLQFSGQLSVQVIQWPLGASNGPRAQEVEAAGTKLID